MNLARWEPDITAFEAADQATAAPRRCGVLWQFQCPVVGIEDLFSPAANRKSWVRWLRHGLCGSLL